MIVAYTGLPGSGKTYSLAADCAGVQKKYGLPIYANFALRGAHYFTDLKQVLNVERGIIAVDEMNTLCPAHKWQSIPVEYQNLWTQSRKQDIDLWYTSQRFSKVVESVRSITNYVWEFDWVFGAPKHRHDKKWRDYIHVAKKYEPADMERRRRKRLERYFFLEKQKVYDLYDTRFRIKTPEYMRLIGDITENPENLPVFADDLALTGDPVYEAVDNEEFSDDGI